MKLFKADYRDSVDAETDDGGNSYVWNHGPAKTGTHARDQSKDSGVSIFSGMGDDEFDPYSNIGSHTRTDSDVARDVNLELNYPASDRRGSNFSTGINEGNGNIVMPPPECSKDYMRPRNYRPYFCIFVLLFTTMMILIEIGENGWKLEPFELNPMLGPSVETLKKLGAKVTENILDGEVYRLFTPMVLHAGILHLLFNSLGLINIGFPAEREFGHVRIAIIFVASGVMGTVFSAIMLPQQVGVGASGAIFGLFGAAWADLIQNWSLYREQARCLLIQLSFATILNLGLGLLPFLDNFAHLGGFITGLILGFTMLVQHRYDFDGFRKKRLNYQLILQALSIIVVPVMFVTMILVLFLEVDVANECSWCPYMSCISMPPGAADNEKWWDCHPCAMSPLTVSNYNPIQATYNLTCPSGIPVVFDVKAHPTYSYQSLLDDNSLIKKACKLVCPDR